MKNPKECFTKVQNQTFIVLNELPPPECKDGSEPLTFHHETFSRFNFVIISADKKATTANIRTFENEHAGSLYRMAEEEKKRGMEAFRNSNGVA